MTPFETFKLYVSIRNHFNQKNYDYFLYNGKSRTSQESFEKRKDKMFFLKLSKHEDVLGFLVSNFLENSKTWIKELAYSENAEKIYNDWLKRKQSLTYQFKQDISKLDDDFNGLFKVEHNQHPIILKSYLSGDVSLETFCILLEITNSKKYLDKSLESDIIWEELSLKVKKYTPFIHYDREKIKKICLDKFDSK